MSNDEEAWAKAADWTPTAGTRVLIAAATFRAAARAAAKAGLSLREWVPVRAELPADEARLYWLQGDSPIEPTLTKSSRPGRPQ